MNPIHVESLRKSLGGHLVLDGAALQIPPGSVYGLLGRNGAGKTTLIKCLVGLLKEDAGRALVLGEAMAAASAAAKAGLAYVAEVDILPPWARIADVTELEQVTRASFDHAGIEQWLSSESLMTSRKIGSLSKGQRKRLELELALAGRPSVLVLDEPFSGVDPVSRAEVQERLLSGVADRGTAVLLSSHVLTDLERLCDRIGVLAGRRIALDVEMDVLKGNTCLLRHAAADSAQMPADVEILAMRSNGHGRTWIVSAQELELEYLTRRGFQTLRPGLEELGVELIRCLDPRGESHA